MGKIFKKYKTIILYIIFGGLTTLVNIVSYFVFKHTLSFSTGAANVSAWFLSVIFAFVTNKYFVFDSPSKKGIMLQLISFFGARILSGVLDTGIVVVFIDYLTCPELPVKVISNVIVIILNYVASKFLIFR